MLFGNDIAAAISNNKRILNELVIYKLDIAFYKCKINNCDATYILTELPKL